MKRVACIAIVLAACTSGPVYEEKYPYEEGWRVGKVTHVGPAEAITERSSKDCRAGARAEGHGARTFARVLLQWGRTYRSIVALVPADERVATGDEVYVDFQDCGREVAPRHKGRTR